MVETIAGLAVLLIVMGILALFFGPLFVGLPALTEKNRSHAEMASLQELLVRIGDELELPWWLPQSTFEVTATSVVIHDLSKKYTLHDDAQPDLLTIQVREKVMTIVWKGLSYQFHPPGSVGITVIFNDDKRITGIELQLADGTDNTTLELPLSAVPLSG